jgi:DNA processing protein
MAVPGPITSAMSSGCHHLLRERPATVVVTRAEEVIEQCGHLGELADPLTGASRPRDALGPVVSRVFDAVPVRTGRPVDRIATVCGLRPEHVQASLVALADLGLVERADTGWRMSRLGRAQRSAGVDAAAAELPLDWL